MHGKAWLQAVASCSLPAEITFSGKPPHSGRPESPLTNDDFDSNVQSLIAPHFPVSLHILPREDATPSLVAPHHPMLTTSGVSGVT